MAAGKYNFTLEQGTTFSREITVQDSGSAMNLTGYTPRMQMRSTHDSSTIALTFTATISMPHKVRLAFQQLLQQQQLLKRESTYMI